MVYNRHFLNAEGLIALALLSLFMGFLIFILLSPFFTLLGVGSSHLAGAFLIIWVLVYMGTVTAALIAFVSIPELKKSFSPIGSRRIVRKAPRVNRKRKRRR